MAVSGASSLRLLPHHEAVDCFTDDRDGTASCCDSAPPPVLSTYHGIGTMKSEFHTSTSTIQKSLGTTDHEDIVRAPPSWSSFHNRQGASMAIINQVCTEDKNLSTTLGGRKQLQRLVRKIQHVLIIKHCIDDLKKSNALQHWQENETEPRCLHAITKDPGFLKDVPGLPILPDLQDASKDTGSSNSSWLAQLAALGPTWKKQTIKELLEAPPSSTGLSGLENILDQYVAECSGRIQETKDSVIKASQDLWISWSKGSRSSSRNEGKNNLIAASKIENSWIISWAKKRCLSCRDQRVHTLLAKLVDRGGKLHILKDLIDAYSSLDFDRPRESLIDVISRLRAVFNVGWFFEWPSGRHPLNSTWPWADVKPSLLVLWGVCWMFGPVQNSLPRQSLQSFWPQQPVQQSFFPTWQGGIPSTYGSLMLPMDSAQQQTLLPGFDLAARTQSQPSQSQQPIMNFPPLFDPAEDFDSSLFLTGIRTRLCDASPLASHSVTGPSQVLQPGSFSYLTNLWQQNVKSDIPPSVDGVGNSIRRQPQYSSLTNVEANTDPVWFDPLASTIFQAERAITQANSNQIQYHFPTPQRSHPLPSNNAPMPSPIPFSYPPLDNMSGLHESRPYMAQERDYPQIPDHDYDQNHDQHDGLPRYPSPPNAGLSDNPYNSVTQQLAEAAQNGGTDMVVDNKSESDAPSPGRSKPIPKPDREVTKLDNGRFFCNWPNCTEDVKDFGRKCEWNKHMDKHDRPYKCQAEGCEKLPGFTYSGGLLRHEREVHNKHGGPRKQLNCPHPNCKRHTGKGFSRQENLNEHMRRVHTDVVAARNGEDTEDESVQAQATGKRKRTGRSDDEDNKEEMKRLKQENEDLRRQTEALTQQSQEMMRQLMQLQANQINVGMHNTRMAPPAQMT